MNVDFVFTLIAQRWKQLLLVTVTTAAVTAAILYLQPPVYKSHAVYTAANPNLGDRANIFRTQFWDQYFYYGSEVDNDRLMAMSQSDEMMRWLIDSFNLRNHYQYRDTVSQAYYMTYAQLKENLQFIKNEFGHVKIVVWDEDKVLAAALANAIVEKTNQKAIAAANNMKQRILQKLRLEYQNQKDSLQQVTGTDAFTSMRRQAIMEQLLEKEKLIQQFTTSINDVNGLFVIEKALPALRKDKPLILQGALIAALAAFAFSVLLVLLSVLRRKA